MTFIDNILFICVKFQVTNETFILSNFSSACLHDWKGSERKTKRKLIAKWTLERLGRGLPRRWSAEATSTRGIAPATRWVAATACRIGWLSSWASGTLRTLLSRPARLTFNRRKSICWWLTWMIMFNIYFD